MSTLSVVVFIVLIIVLSCLCTMTLYSKQYDVVMKPHSTKDLKSTLSLGCVQKANQDCIEKALLYASREVPVALNKSCMQNTYTYQTLNEQRRRILKMYTQLAIRKLNYSCKNFARNNKIRPYKFVFIEFVNAISNMSSCGNTRWRVDVLAQELTLHLSLRILIDFTIHIKECDSKSNKIKTCAEYTTFPFPKYFLGYPSLDQMIPLPTQVVSTGPGLVLSTKGIQKEFPNFKALFLNSVRMKNSDLALGTELPSTLHTYTTPAVNDTTLQSSAIPKKRLTRNDVQFPEKFYTDCLEKTKKAQDTDINNNYTWIPPNYTCDGKQIQQQTTTGNTALPNQMHENKYKKSGSSVPFKVSMLPPTYPNGWVQPAPWRNRWPRLWSEPRDRFEYPSTPVGYYWNNLGVRYPIPKPNQKHPGIRWSTEQTPRTPQYWPTITGLPINYGPNYWLFNKTRGFQANLPHGG